MDLRCLKCNRCVPHTNKKKFIECTCGGAVKSLKFVKLIPGIHPWGNEYSVIINGKYFYPFYKDAHGYYIVDRHSGFFIAVDKNGSNPKMEKPTIGYGPVKRR